jgi:Uncharacterized protein conserved in bacteria
MKNERVEYYDFLRGVAIIGVIGIHAFWAYQDHLKEDGMTMFDINIFVRQLIGCCVPMFLALSGFFLAKKDVSTLSKYGTFLRKQVARVYIPCLIFSLPFLYWGICKSLGMSNSFIDVCTQRWLIFKGDSIIGNILYYLVCAKGGGLFPFWVFYYVIGVYYGKGYRLGISWKWLLVAAIAIVPLLYAETYYMVTENGWNLPAAMGNRKFTWILYCTVCLMLMFEAVSSYRSNAFTRFLSIAGEYSYGVYLIHLFFLLFVIKSVSPNIHWMIETILSLLLSMGFIYVCRKISLPFSKKYLGF